MDTPMYSTPLCMQAAAADKSNGAAAPPKRCAVQPPAAMTNKHKAVFTLPPESSACEQHMQGSHLRWRHHWLSHCILPHSQRRRNHGCRARLYSMCIFRCVFNLHAPADTPFAIVALASQPVHSHIWHQSSGSAWIVSVLQHPLQ